MIQFQLMDWAQICVVGLGEECSAYGKILNLMYFGA